MKVSRTTITLVGLIAGYVVLAAFELPVSLDGFKPALFADGLHNVLEIIILGANLVEYWRTHRGHQHSHIPQRTALAVAIIAVLSAATAVVVGAEAIDSGQAASLAAISLLFAGLGAALTSRQAQDDLNLASVLQHLQVDASTSGAALLAYLLILVGAPAGVDPLLTVVGGMLAVWFYLRFKRHSANT
jgi:Co/Zn/Cd efflux system component